MLGVNYAYIYLYSVRASTPFFQAFGPLLFGKPAVCAIDRALAKLRQCNSLSQLRKVFGSHIPQALLERRASGDNSRNRLFSLEAIFWSFLDQVQTPNGSCREAVRKVMALACRKLPNHSGEPMSADTSAYCQARARLPLEVLDQIHDHLVDRLQARIPGDALWHGRHVRLVDGTAISMPDTPANQARWPQSRSQKPGCGFPLMNLTGIFCLLSGALIKASYSDRHTHESRLFQDLWSVLNPGDLVVADRGYCSFATFAGLLARKVDCLMRLPEKKIRKAIGSHLPKTAAFDVTINWKRPAKCPRGIMPDQFDLLPKSLPVRVVRYTIAQRGFRTRCVTLVTTLLDATIASSALALLYCRRWGVELHFREIKIILNMDVLRCLSPHMIERELRMHFIAYNLIRCIMQKAALTYEVDLCRVSFKGCLDTVRQFANALQGAEHKPRTVAAMTEEMLQAIARDPLPLRPNRCEPRVRKRRPKNYRLLTKSRLQMSPLPHRKYGVENLPKRALT
jgi:hypothetical protein